MFDFDNMSKEQLIEILKDVEKNRALTYEDQMKLHILDHAPFTIWTSNRDCIITLWEGECERLYGYKKEDAIGKDYVPLFVDPHEAMQARRDQISIIDHKKPFHNIANDKANNGNNLHLLTNCFRIQDIRTGEFLNAEMGILIDFYENEKNRLEEVISESRKVKSYMSQFIDTIHQRKNEFNDRKKALKTAVQEIKLSAAKSRKKTTYDSIFQKINSDLHDLQNDFDILCENYTSKMKDCGNENECKEVNIEFSEQYITLIDRYDDITCDFFTFSVEIAPNSYEKQDELRMNIHKESGEIREKLFSSQMQLDTKIENLIGAGADKKSERLQNFELLKGEFQKLKAKIDIIAEKLRKEITKSNTAEMLDKLEIEIVESYKSINLEYIRLEKKISEV